MKSNLWKKKIKIPSFKQENCKIRETVFSLKSSILQNINKMHSILCSRYCVSSYTQNSVTKLWLLHTVTAYVLPTFKLVHLNSCHSTVYDLPDTKVKTTVPTWTWQSITVSYMTRCDTSTVKSVFLIQFQIIGRKLYWGNSIKHAFKANVWMLGGNLWECHQTTIIFSLCLCETHWFYHLPNRIIKTGLSNSLKTL